MDANEWNVEEELSEMRDYFSEHGTKSKKKKEELAYLLMRVIFSSGSSANAVNATAYYLSTFKKFHFNDALDGILEEIGEVNASRNSQAKNSVMKWDAIIEKLENYLDADEKEKDDAD